MVKTVNVGNKGRSVTKNISIYRLHLKEKVGVNKWNRYMLVCIIPYWEGCSFLIQCNSCLEEKYRVEVFIANLFVLNGIPGDVIVSSATGGICDCWLLSYTQIGFIIIFTIIQPSLFITLISNSRTHSPVRLLVLSLFLLCVSFWFFFVFVFLFFS